MNNIKFRQLKPFWINQVNHFHRMLIRLMMCDFWIETKIDSSLSGFHKIFRKHYAENPGSTDDKTICLFFQNGMEYEEKNRLISLSLLDEPDDIDDGETKTEYKGFREIEKIKFNDKKSLKILPQYCMFLRSMFYLLAQCDIAPFDIGTINILFFLGNLVTSKSYEALGFWQGEMKTILKNIKSASHKTKKKEANKEKIKRLLESQDFNVNRKFLLKAQDEIDRGERTIKNLVKEIMKEDSK